MSKLRSVKGKKEILQKHDDDGDDNNGICGNDHVDVINPNSGVGNEVDGDGDGD